MLKYSENLPHGLSIISDGMVRKNFTASDEHSFFKIQNIANHFIDHPDELVVPVYSFSYDAVPLTRFGGKDKRIKYWDYQYDMKRLFIVSKEEKKFFDMYFNTDKGYWDVRQLFIEENKDDYPALFDFCQKVEAKRFYHDLHSGNFLKDEFGDYKLIDLEGFRCLEMWKYNAYK